LPAISLSHSQYTSKFWRCSLPMNRPWVRRHPAGTDLTGRMPALPGSRDELSSPHDSLAAGPALHLGLLAVDAQRSSGRRAVRSWTPARGTAAARAGEPRADVAGAAPRGGRTDSRRSAPARAPGE